MVNSRQLVECVASALGMPLTAVTGHMRYLREAEMGLVTTGGRGITAPPMTAEDAASLVCAVYGSQSVQESSDALLSLKRLPARQSLKIQQTKPYDSSGEPAQLFSLDLPAKHNIVQGLAAVLRLLAREDELLNEIRFRSGGRDLEIYARFNVQYPEHFASLTVGVHGRFSEVWTYGNRGRPRTRQNRECQESTLREIARCLAK